MCIRLKMILSISEHVTVVYPLFSAHKMCWIPCVLCMCCIQRSQGEVTQHLLLCLYTEEVQWGGAFPHKGAHLLQTFTYCIVVQVLGSTIPVMAQRKTFFFSFYWGVPSLLLSSCLCLKTHACRSLLSYNVHLLCSCTSFDIVGLDYSPVFKLVFCTNLGIYSHSTPIFRQNIFDTMSNKMICLASCCSYIWGCSKPLLGFLFSLLPVTEEDSSSNYRLNDVMSKWL